MTAVQTCTVPDPSNMNSTASRQFEIPPIPEIGILNSASRASSETILSAIGFTAGPQYPPCAAMPLTFGYGIIVSISTPITELIVLINETASALPFCAARPGGTIFVTFGVSFTITGKLDTSLTHSVTMQVYSGT